ncbi:DUF1906 domain-containing protein [Lactobacillus sp. DCY120]|uniref:DUF1906 domain-containing protein n=1 Tax=Bombilactobacillus apium TaxID=2675299 RepID=A0A850R2P5_9LACO|nr:glycoside hydrolase domain-containing protein [Bombilactobacillus apium]NVY96620.1 DUF1906 domain-containing protein [Bombilactobacillus apium]
MADQMVLATQKWLNKTYGSLAGFDRAPENGQTGWATIYSLREGLQHELGITSLANGFGPLTKSKLATQLGRIQLNSSSKIVKLIKGAFWCKGINPQSFTEKYDVYLGSAIKNLQKNAGLTANGVLTVNLIAALFDMSAFTLLAKGDARIREMQQALNSQYSEQLGVLPCDGIYQRDTNQALIYYLQRIEGLGSTANGVYGPGTISRTPTVNPGAQGAIVKLIQYGLYVNGFYTGSFNGNFDTSVSTAIVDFRKFMKLPPYTATADLTVIKGLLTSNGNTNRDSDTFDTATQLSAAQAQMIKNYGFKIVGRYLTGSVGTGTNRRNKNLTTAEIKNLTAAGLKIFPIYEDGGYEVSYFTATQGINDAAAAVLAARKLGFPRASTIYFAVDVDIQAGDLAGTVVPYFQSIAQYCQNLEYQVGIYGTRNACQAVKSLVTHSFVADMSYGWSGNLGFKMPHNWAFDQFVEYGIGGVDIDQGASSGRDLGTNKFAPRTDFVSPNSALKKLLGDFNLSVGKTVKIYKDDTLELSVTARNSLSAQGGSGSITINKNGISSVDLGAWLRHHSNLPSGVLDIVLDKTGSNSLFTKIKSGLMTISSAVNTDRSYSVTITIDIFETDQGPLSDALSLVYKAKVKINNNIFQGINPEKITNSVAISVLIIAGIIIVTNGGLPAVSGILEIIQLIISKIA